MYIEQTVPGNHKPKLDTVLLCAPSYCSQQGLESVSPETESWDPAHNKALACTVDQTGPNTLHLSICVHKPNNTIKENVQFLVGVSDFELVLYNFYLFILSVLI